MNVLETFARIVFAPSTVYPEAPEAQPRTKVCGVPDCEDGQIVDAGPPLTVVECDTHNARTTWDTDPAPKREQQIIRVQDQWRQHGTRERPR